MPPRAVFRERQWPEGYVFPCCSSCNNSTREDERVVALMSRFSFREMSSGELQEMERLLRAVNARFPALIQRMQGASATEVRAWLRRANLSLPHGVSTADINMVNVPPEVDGIVKAFGERLVRALHYKHTGRIVPSTGTVRVSWYTNANLLDNTFPRQVFERLKQRPTLIRASENLTQQFNYSYEVSASGDLGAFLSAFGGNALVLTSLVIFDPAVAAEAAAIAEQRRRETAAT